MTALDIFTYSGQQVRTVIVDGEPWFVAADVCRILDHSNSRMALASLDDDEKGVSTIDTPGGAQSMSVINEPGLYSLIMRSRMAEAKAFKRWLTHDVLPQIRRTGKYAGAQHVEYQIPQSYAAALELAFLQAKEIEEKEQALVAVAPKVAAYETLMDADGAYSMDAAAKILGIGRTTLFNRLRAEGIIQAGQRTPYQRYAHHFNVTASTYMDSEDVPHTSFTSKVRPSGLDFIAKKLGLVAVAS